MTRHVFAVVLLAIVAAASLAFIVRPRVAHAQVGKCSIPRSAGTYRGGYSPLVFEREDGILTRTPAS